METTEWERLEISSRKFNAFINKTSNDFFVKIGRPILKFTYKLKEFRIDKLILKRDL